MFTYILSVIKPTFPFVYDAVAHAFFYQHHITTVHKVNGKQHVHHEFLQEAKKENSGNNNSDIKKIIPTEEHFSLPFYNTLEASFVPHNWFCRVIFKLYWRPINSNFPPPKQQPTNITI